MFLISDEGDQERKEFFVMKLSSSRSDGSSTFDFYESK